MKGILTKTESLYSTKDVAAIRDKLVKEQKSIDPILNEPFKESAVCDHSHESQHVRAALNRNTNAFEGLVFNAHKRCLKWLTDVPLAVILRNLADYLERDYSHNPYHPGWIKRVTIDYNKLPSKQQDAVLLAFGQPRGRNQVERKKYFKIITLDRNLGYDAIRQVIHAVSTA